MKTRLLSLVVAAMATLATAGTARAEFVDTFGNPANPADEYEIAKSSPNPYVSGPYTVATGVDRTVTVRVLEPLPPARFSVVGQVGNFDPPEPDGDGIFSLAANNVTRATGMVTYTLTGSARNLSSAGSIDLTFLGAQDPGVFSPLPLMIEIATGAGGAGGTRTQSGTITASATSTTYSFNLGSFGGSGSYSDVDSIRIILNDNPGSQYAADFALDTVSVRAVPAPAGIVLAGIGFVGLIGRNRLLRRKTAVA